MLLELGVLEKIEPLFPKMLTLHKRLLFHIFDKYFDFRSIFELSQTCKKANRLFKEYFNGNANCYEAKFYIYVHIRKKLIFKKIFKYSELVKGLPRHRQLKFNKKILKLQNIKINERAVTFNPKYKIDYLITGLFPEFHRYFKLTKAEYNIVKSAKVLPKWAGYFGDEMKFSSEQQKTEYYIGRFKAGLPVNYCNEDILFWAIYKKKFDFAEQNIKHANSAVLLAITMLPNIIPTSLLFKMDNKYSILVGMRSFIDVEKYFLICHVKNDFDILNRDIKYYYQNRHKFKTRYLFNYIKQLGDEKPNKSILADLFLQAEIGNKKDILEYRAEKK